MQRELTLPLHLSALRVYYIKAGILLSEEQKKKDFHLEGSIEIYDHSGEDGVKKLIKRKNL